MMNAIQVPEGAFGLDPETCRAAAITLADRANGAADLRQLLECCGLIP